MPLTFRANITLYDIFTDTQLQVKFTLSKEN